MRYKTIITTLYVVSILSACLVWFTRTEWLPSLSAFALSDNAIFYRMMHITASWALLMDYVKYNRVYNGLIGVGMGLILMFDMYNFNFLHNLFTAIVLLYACYSVLKQTKGFEFSVSIFLTGIALLVFGLGYFIDSFHLLMAEIMAIGSILVAKLRELWINNS